MAAGNNNNRPIITAININKGSTTKVERDIDDDFDPSSPWNMSTCVAEYPTNAYGMIDFVNENLGRT